MALSIHDFAKLLLVKLAENGSTINFREPKKKLADIPFNYRERIENILCADNGWKDEFSELIDISDYFDDHFYWEEKLAKELLCVIKELKKDISFDIISEYMSVLFYPSEIQKILRNYDDEIAKKMNHFANLVLAPIYSRRHKEQIFDYSARSAAKMRELFENSK